MDLRSAVARAMKFAKKDPEKDGMNAFILLQPHYFDPSKPVRLADTKKGQTVCIPDQVGYIAASDGTVTTRIFLDLTEHVPHCICFAEALNNATKQLKKEGFTLERAGDAAVVVRGADTGAFFQVPCAPAPHGLYDTSFPEQLHIIHDWERVLRLMHITKKVEKNRPELLFLHAYSGGVETSDVDRVARVPVVLPIPEGKLVHRALFRDFPRKVGYVGFAVAGDTAFVAIDEELRHGPASSDKDFYDLRSRLPEDFNGYQSTAPTMSLMQAVKFATTASPVDAVELLFNGLKLEVSGLGVDSTKESVHVVDLVAASSIDPVRVVVRGRLFWDSLAAQDAPHLQLGYTSPEQPLRLETGDGYVEQIWPLIPSVEPS